MNYAPLRWLMRDNLRMAQPTINIRAVMRNRYSESNRKTGKGNRAARRLAKAGCLRSFPSWLPQGNTME